MRTLEAFSRLSTAEEYLDFFAIPYDPAVVNVNRLHILKRFAGYKAQADAELAARGEAEPAERLERYRECLVRAYRDFLVGTALDYRLFKVLQEHAPEAFVAVTALAGAPAAKAGAPRHRSGAAPLPAATGEGRDGR